MEKHIGELVLATIVFFFFTNWRSVGDVHYITLSALTSQEPFPWYQF